MNHLDLQRHRETAESFATARALACHGLIRRRRPAADLYSDKAVQAAVQHATRTIERSCRVQRAREALGPAT